MTSTTSVEVKPLLHVEHLSKSYGDKPALIDLNLDLQPGRIVGLLGENGCGKTTLMKILAGVLSDYEGTVRINGNAPGPASKADVAFLPDARYLPAEARVSYFIGLFSDFFADFDAAKARELLGFFGLDERARLKEMSKGMREKVQIALTMSRNAKLFLLDEPISGVDPAARDVILRGILQGAGDDATLVIATHLIHDLEPILDTVVMLRHGKVVLAGDADDLRASHNLSIDALFKETYR